MSDLPSVERHYSPGGLMDRIRAGVAAAGLTPQSVTLKDLAPLDEFHIGGRAATEALLEQIGLTADDIVLDIGCGIGGAARYTASQFGPDVVGVDLTAEYVSVGRELNDWLGISDKVDLRQADATAIPFDADHFRAAYMLHVGMNIADKEAFFANVRRVLKPDGIFAVYDIMQIGEGDPTFPVPWASDASQSHLALPESYVLGLERAGFEIVAQRNRRDFALDFFERLKAAQAQADGPPPLGLHLLMGATAPQKIGNMIAAVSNGIAAPVEIIARAQPLMNR